MSRARWKTFLWLAGSLLALAVMALMVLLWLNTHTRIERTIDLPPQGEAAYNPLYLLRQALHADGVDSVSRRYLQLDSAAPGNGDTIILYGDPRQLTARDVERLLDWVAQGGHLIARLPAHRHSTNPSTRSTGALLDRLGIRRIPENTRFCNALQFPETAQEMMFCADERFRPAVHTGVAWGDSDSGYAFARRRWGGGLVDVVSQLGFLDNTHLERPGRAALTRQLLAPNYGQGTVHLIYGQQLPSLWQLLFEHGRMAWVPLLLALLAWLWMRMPRFGPLRAAPLPVRRALLEHIEASGEHLYRYGNCDLLLDALRERFQEWLRRHDPLTASLQGEARLAAIAALTRMPRLDIADALETDARRMNAHEFQRRAAVLVQMMRG